VVSFLHANYEILYLLTDVLLFTAVTPHSDRFMHAFVKSNIYNCSASEAAGIEAR
jgi:hypothetical protein